MKTLKCKICNKEVEVGETTISVMCEDCTEDKYESWMIKSEEGNCKEVDEKMSDKNTEKKKPMSVQVKELLKEGKSIQEINETTKIKVPYILAVIKKKEKLEKQVNKKE